MYTENDRYTEILTKAIEDDFGNKFRYLGCREKTEDMVKVFREPDCPISKKQELEEQITTILWENDSHTEYRKLFEDKGKLRCATSRNLKDTEKVNEAADIYLAHAAKLPPANDIDKTFVDGLYEVYSHFKSSEDYMTRLVHRRLEALKSFEIKDNDTTRLLILKQLLKELNFFENSPYYDEAFKNYISAQKEVATENTFDFTALTDKVFEVVDLKSESLSREKEELINHLKYYGYITPCSQGLYENLRKIFSRKLLNSFDEDIITISDVFKVDLFELSPDNMKRNIPPSMLEETIKLIQHYKKEGKKNPDSLIIKFPAEYKIPTLCTFYPDIKLNKEIAELITLAIPGEYLKDNKISEGMTLADTLQCDALIKITHSDLQKKFPVKRKLYNLIGKLEKLAFDLDYDLPVRTSKSKLSTDVRSSFNAVIEHLSKEIKIKGKLKKEILSSVEKSFLPLKQESMSFKEILKTIKKVFTEGDKFDKKAIDEIINSVFRSFNESLYAERIFERAEARYANARKATSAKKFDGEIDNKIINILSMIDNLAAGRFDEQRTTREFLYIFAIGFKMTVFTEAENEIFDESTDVQKNLFYDIYADNFVNRFKNDSFVELDGYGINYKNFAELCFIYSIHNRENKSSSLVLKEAYDLINECKEKGKTKEQLEKTNKAISAQLTEKYKEDFTKRYLNANKSDFLNYVLNNCVCVTSTTKTKTSAETRTAQKLYGNLFKEVKKLEKDVLKEIIDSYVFDYLNQSYNFHKEWENVYMKTSHCTKCEYRFDYKNFRLCPGYLGTGIKDCTSAFDNYLESDPDKNEARIKIEKNVYRRAKLRLLKPLWSIKETYKDTENKEFLTLLDQLEKEFKTSFLVVSNDRLAVETVTRTRFIALFYYYLILSSQKVAVKDEELVYNEDEAIQNTNKFEPIAFYTDELFDNFGDFYDYIKNDAISLKIDNKTICNGLNECLKACGYQTFNPKNIYDVFVLFWVFRNYFNKFHNPYQEVVI